MKINYFTSKIPKKIYPDSSNYNYYNYLMKVKQNTCSLLSPYCKSVLDFGTNNRTDFQ